MTHGFGTPSVAIATTPTVISTFFSHILASRKRKSQSKQSLKSGGPGGGPENQLSYEEGLKVVRRFLEFASHHGVEEVQSFTAMWVPTPHWVRRETVVIPDINLRAAENILSKHLSTYGPDGDNGGGLKLIGGDQWWRVRGRTLEGEWIEVTGSGSIKDNSEKEVLEERVILYIHGGAFFFSSLETHRYQVQRHARKAGARAFSPAYRLAPQYPFPCGLLDSLASYLYLIDPPPGATHDPILPTNIIMMGDSAGAGMVISLLILIREMGLPMPAGASLVSPWVDLTHSMPSIGGWDGGDFIPSSGFHYKPSCAWPPLTGDGVTVTMPDGSEKHFDEQIQMYCPNNLLTHPLVSPVNQGSLGGLCPLLIMGGGGELLRDEIMYIAHKTASPTTYPPGSLTLSQYPDQAGLVDKYQPTKVHLQIYEGCCHVVPTLSWTRSSKYMYRAAANFNIWAFTAAQKAVKRKLHHERSHHSLKHTSRQNSTAPSSTSVPPSGTTSATGSRTGSTIDLTQPIIGSTAASAANREDIDFGDLESEASSDSDDSDSTSTHDEGAEGDKGPIKGIVTVSGSEPLFSTSNIVSERISTHGKIRDFEPVEEIPALNPNLKEEIGQIHGGGAIQKWLNKRKEWDLKYSKDLKKWKEIKEKDRKLSEKNGFLTRNLFNEKPPLCSLAGIYDLDLAKKIGQSVDGGPSGKQSGFVGMWMKMGTKADKENAGGNNLIEIKSNVEEQIRKESISTSIDGSNQYKQSLFDEPITIPEHEVLQNESK
uniref:Lipase/esterase n=1 Tax=Kwoniella pini CBS 10737 TaxID=1296096 RepID=A0A1B9HXD0_9TREE|nr:lipase/esterase [Kwoniella pini CBS 10737]OCF47922.1 lipase/esterase [Kwoniella pini CBS 10737]